MAPHKQVVAFLIKNFRARRQSQAQKLWFWYTHSWAKSNNDFIWIWTPIMISLDIRNPSKISNNLSLMFWNLNTSQRYNWSCCYEEDNISRNICFSFSWIHTIVIFLL